MKNMLKYFIAAMILTAPSLCYADFDITTYLQQLVKTAQKDGIGKTVKDQMDNLQNDATNLVNGDFSNIDPDKAKSLALKAYKEANKKFKLDSKLPKSFTDKINGTGSNPELEEIAKKEFTVSKRSGDDVEKNKERDEKVNDLMIEDVSAMYARGLVRRYQLENETKEEVDDYNNISGVQAVYISTIHRANSRWLSMLQAETSLMVQTATKQMTSIRPDEAPEEESDGQAAKGE